MAPDEDSSARRLRSRQALLDVIKQQSGATRADLSRLTGLSRSAVAEAVHDLLNERLVSEDVLDPGGKGSGRGRPAALLVATPPGGVVIGLDFGRDHIAAAVASTEGEILTEQWAEASVDTQARAALDAVSGLVSRLLGQLGLTRADVRSIAAGIPAPLDIRTSQIREPGILPGWTGLHPAQELSSMFGSKVLTRNDAELGAIGELRFGAGRGQRDFVYVNASEGIGASLVLNGTVYRGSQGLSGEIGHTQVPDQALPCRCGKRGCLETVVSSTFVTDRMEELGIELADEAFPLAEAGQNRVLATIVTEAGRVLGRTVADLINWLNPAAVILGGALGTAGKPLLDGARESIARYGHPSAVGGLDVRVAELGLRSELMGAVAVASQQSHQVS